MSAVLQHGWTPAESYEAMLVRTRTMSRGEYNRARANAHRLECEAGLLRMRYPKDAARTLAEARRLRLDISVPVDATEARREAAWRRLYAAAEYHRVAFEARRTARAVTRSLRRRRDDVGPELRAVVLPIVAAPAFPISQTDEE